MKIILPLNKSILTTIPSHVNFLSIILVSEKGIDWGTLDRNYTNIVKSYFFPRSMIDNFYEFLVKALSNNYYINLRLDEYYLSCSNFYLKRHKIQHVANQLASL